MRRYVLLTGLAAGFLLAASGADAQSREYQPRSTNPNAPDPTQMAVDVSQYDPNVQIGEILRTTKMLVQQNEQLRAELTEMQRKLDGLEARGKALSNSLNTTTGETIGSMVAKIKDKVAGPY